MKEILQLLIFIFFATITSAQVPQGFKYQGAARDADGELIANTRIAIKLVFLQAGTTPVYEEEHRNVMTNAFGLFSLTAGEGTATVGTFDGIDWSADSYFLRVEMDSDLSDGLAYSLMGMSELQSVPFALYALDAGNVDDADADPINEIQRLDLTGNDLSLSKGGGMVTLPGGSGDEWWAVDDPAKQHLYNTNIGSIQLGNSELAKSYLNINEDYGSIGGQIFLTDGIGSSQLNMAFNRNGNDFNYFKLRSYTDAVGPKFTIFGAFEDDTPYEFPLWELNYEDYYLMHSFGASSVDNELRIRGNDFGTSIFNMQFSHGTDVASKSWTTYAREFDKEKTLETTFVEFFSGGGAYAKKASELKLDSANNVMYEVYGKVKGETASFISENNTVLPISNIVEVSSPIASFGIIASLDTAQAAIFGRTIDMGAGVAGFSGSGIGGLFGSEDGLALATTTGDVGLGTALPSPYKVKVSHEEFGLAINNRISDNVWEFWTTTDDPAFLNLYYNFDFMGAFSPDDGSYGAPSDASLKKEIEPLYPILLRVMQLKPSTYRFLKANEGTRPSIGFVAQEVDEVFPELVMEINDTRNDQKLLALKYDGFAPIAIKAIQELNSIIEAQQLQIDMLEKRLEKLEEK